MNFIQKQRFLLLDPKKNPEIQWWWEATTEQQKNQEKKTPLPEANKAETTKETQDKTRHKKR